MLKFNCILVFILIFGVAKSKSQKVEEILLPFYQDALWGYIDSTGEVVIPPKFKSAGAFSEGLAPVSLNGQYGYINKKGQLVIPDTFDYAEPFEDGIAKVWQAAYKSFSDSYKQFDVSFKYIKKNGRLFLEGQYKFVHDFDHTRNRGIAKTITGRYGVIDKMGRIIVDTVYLEIIPFKHGFCLLDEHYIEVTLDGVQYGMPTCSIVDDNGVNIVPAKRYVFYDRYGWNSHNNNLPIFSIAKGDSSDILKPAAINYKGQLLIAPPSYFPNYINDYIKHKFHGDTFVTELSLLSENRWFGHTNKGYKWYLFDGQGNLIKDRPYSWVYESNPLYPMGFYNGIAVVLVGGNIELIDTMGNTIKAFSQSFDISSCEVMGNFWSLMTSYGYYFYDPKLDKILPIHIKCIDYSFKPQNGFIRVFLFGDILAYINKEGKIIWQQKFSSNLQEKPKLVFDQMLCGPLQGCNEEHADYVDNRLKPQMLEQGHPFPKGVLGLTLQAEKKVPFNYDFLGCVLSLTNATCDTQWIQGDKGGMEIQLQALHPSGQWMNIHFQLGSWCGNSQYMAPLVPNQVEKFVVPIFDGVWNSKIRAVLYQSNRYDKYNCGEIESVFSNEIDVRINPAQFWRRSLPVSDRRWKPHSVNGF